jgi:hypothetical protein
MKRSLSFRLRTTCKTSGQFIDVLIIFFGRSRLEMNVLDDEIQNALKTPDPLPDAIALVSLGAPSERLADVWRLNPTRTRTLMQRGKTDYLEYLKELAIWEFSQGNFQKIYRAPESRENFDFDVSTQVLECLSKLVEERGAYIEAPSGHVFRHPSKRETKDFLLASELLHDEIDAYFVALAIASVAWSRLKNTTVVHIDTMGIYPVARALEEISRVAGSVVSPDTSWEIDSFHSHGGINGLHSVIGSNEIVLVSASTSGSMTAKLANSGVSEDALITLLDITSVNRKGTIVYARDRHIKPSRQATVRNHGETVIELTGEYFAARGKKPRALTLTKNHKPVALDVLLEHFSEVDVLKLNRRRANGTSTIDLVSLDELFVAKNPDFKKWIADEIRLKTPISVTHVLPVPGPGGIEMANACIDVIFKCTGVKVKLIDSENLQQLAGAEDVGGVLVCAPVVGNGHGLRSLARDLRELVPKASRHFIVGVGLPETGEAWIRLQQFLEQSGNKSRPYLFSCWAWLSTGAAPGRGQAWLSAAQVMQKAEQLALDSSAPWAEDHIQESLKLLGDALEKDANCFLLGAGGVPLSLTQGFVYWDPGSVKLQKCDHAAISFAAITSALQFAREFQNPSLKLASTIHETVVLDVENFLRFNDGVLQASLLRAALPYELDYSRTSDLSEVLREFLEKIFLNHTKNYGEAAPEFALALATGQLRLADADKTKLITKLSGVFKTPSVLLGLIYFWYVS